jgi:hypothetical protein
MALLNVGVGKYVNTDRITYISAKKRDKVIIMFQNELSTGGMGIPPSYLEVKGDEAVRLLRWLEANSEQIGS